MAEAGYSGTPLLKKLGYKDGQKALLIQPPETLPQLSGFDGFVSCKIAKTWRGLSGGPYDMIHVFETEEEKLAANIVKLRESLAQDGVMWISWPKKAARIPATLGEYNARAVALANGLVDIKKCAVDEVWSGLKLVIPVKDRKK